MFLKFLRLGLPAMTGRRCWKYSSIANNLALLHILAVFIFFSCASIIIYSNLSEHLDEFSYKRIREEMDSIRTMLLQPNGRDLLDIEIKSQLFESESHKVYIRIVDRQGRTTKETLGMGSILPASLFSSPEKVLNIHKIKIPDGRRFLLINGPFSEYLERDQGGQLHIGKDISKDDWLTSEILIFLAILLCGVIIFSIISAFYIVSRVLKPLGVVSAQIEQITDLNLNAHLDVALLPVEMQTLGTSFNTMLDRMENSFSKISHYSENLAHELRTPLNNLMLESDILLLEQRSPEEYQSAIKSCTEEYCRLSQLVDRLLFLARADNHQLKLDLEMIDAVRELENVVEYYSEEAHEKGIAVTVVGAASLLVDPILFNRAIDNLLFNSLKFTDEGGSVTLAAHEKENDIIEVSVSDTGSGIDPLLLPKIFDRYFWIESSRKKDKRGTGLGLDIVKAIMKLHGGSINIESELGKGTSVTMKFPPIQLISSAQSAQG